MAEPTRPAAAKLYGRANWIYVPVVASGTLAPTVAEVTAGLDVTNMLIDGNEPTPAQSTNLVEQQRRFGDTINYQFVGTTTYNGGDLVFQFNQQGAALSDSVLAWEEFAAGGVTGFLVRRQNVAKDTAVASGQFVDVFPVEIGPGMPVETGDGETAEGAFTCTYAITSEPAFKIAVLA